MRWLDGIIDSMDMSLSKRWEMVKEKEGLACCSPWGRKELDMTEQLSINSSDGCEISKNYLLLLAGN